MDKVRTNIKFNTTIVELEINKDYEEKVKEDFMMYNRLKKPYKFKSFVDYFMKDKKEKEKEEIGMKILRMMPV